LERDGRRVSVDPISDVVGSMIAVVCTSAGSGRIGNGPESIIAARGWGSATSGSAENSRSLRDPVSGLLSGAGAAACLPDDEMSGWTLAARRSHGDVPGSGGAPRCAGTATPGSGTATPGSGTATAGSNHPAPVGSGTTGGGAAWRGGGAEGIPL